MGWTTFALGIGSVVFVLWTIHAIKNYLAARKMTDFLMQTEGWNRAEAHAYTIEYLEMMTEARRR